MTLRQRLWLIASAAVAMLAALMSLPVVAEESHILVLGRISDDPKSDYEQLKPLLDYVVPQMAGVGIREGRILMARDIQQMASYLQRGRVDWASETAGTGMLLVRRAGARPLLLTERDGVLSNRTVYIAKREAELRDIDGLRGRSIAFENPASTSGYFVPASEILARGLRLAIMPSPRERPTADTVGYVFARSELNLITWVRRGLVDAGAMSTLDWDNPAYVSSDDRRQLVVFHRSEQFPRALEVVSADMDAQVSARLSQVLQGAAADPDAREAMLRFFKTTRFIPIDAQSQQALDRLSANVDKVDTALE